MLTLTGLTLRRGARVLLDDASAAVHPGQRVGIVGANGCGKSSLFALLLGELLPDAGTVALPPRWVVAHVAQELQALDRPAIEFVIDGDAELREVERSMDAAERVHDGSRLGELHAHFAEIGGHAARSRASTRMAGLGFAPSDAARPVAEFSGGWRVRLQLARALMARSDLLLLDEPTNHLDLDAVLWLERWLQEYRGTLLVISHDREFLDHIVDRVCHFDQGKLRLYTGGFSDFERLRAEALEQQNAAHDRQVREVARLQGFVDRFRAKATKARQAQSRLKALERITLVARAQADAPFDFSFADPGIAPDPLLTLEDVVVGYGEANVLEGVGMQIRRGARIGLLGRNGAGKSTLMKLFAGTLTPRAGRRVEGRDLRIGYFAQHQLDQLRPDETALAHLSRIDRAAREQDLRTFLGGFGFRGDDALAPVGPMSGGEKARLALGLIVYRRPQLLLLDEPTNHLDLLMRGALTLALQSFEGALVLVSHDRSLLRSTVDEFWLVGDGRVRPFEGDLEDYAAWLVAAAKPEADAGGRAAGPSRKEERRAAAVARSAAAALRRPVEVQVRKVEAEMAALETVKRALETRLPSPDLYAAERKEELKSSLVEQARVAERLAELESAWLALQEQLEGLT
jgi:ATP-binding cassette subfamily F protein 3